MTVDYSYRKAVKAQGKKRRREDMRDRSKRRKQRKVTEAPCYKNPIITEEDLEWPEDEGRRFPLNLVGSLRVAWPGTKQLKWAQSLL